MLCKAPITMSEQLFSHSGLPLKVGDKVQVMESHRDLNHDPDDNIQVVGKIGIIIDVVNRIGQFMVDVRLDLDMYTIDVLIHPNAVLHVGNQEGAYEVFKDSIFYMN